MARVMARAALLRRRLLRRRSVLEPALLLLLLALALLQGLFDSRDGRLSAAHLTPEDGLTSTADALEPARASEALTDAGAQVTSPDAEGITHDGDGFQQVAGQASAAPSLPSASPDAVTQANVGARLEDQLRQLEEEAEEREESPIEVQAEHKAIPSSGVALSAPRQARRRRGFFTKVFGAVARGAVAAGMAAFLSAFTEPVIKLLLERQCTVQEAVNSVKVKDCLSLFRMMFPSNMLKFPVFEAFVTVFSYSPLSGSCQGVLSGWLFCTVMLPVQNFRFRRRMKLPIDPNLLWQAYPPTALRDIAYGWSRGYIDGVVTRCLVSDSTGVVSTAFLFGITVWSACVVSSPFNEWRSYWVQPARTRLPFNRFFKQERYVRSTALSATIMAASLTVGALFTPVAEALFAVLASPKALALGSIAFLVAVGAKKLHSTPDGMLAEASV